VRQPQMSVDVDAEHGGRWLSLRGRNGREWLWRRAAPEREAVQPGDPFVDAGGLEECVPTVGGVPDHGDAWSRRWTAGDGGLAVDGEGYRLHRRIAVTEDGVVASYRLTAEPGWPFIWAGHALVDVSAEARLIVPAGRPVWVGAPEGTTRTPWPRYGETDLSELGEADGTALMITIPGLESITVADGSDRLTVRLRVAGQPYAIAIWRNLGGWPSDGPYRSIGIEPMLGHTPTLAMAGDGEAVVVPASGTVEWSLAIDA